MLISRLKKNNNYANLLIQLYISKLMKTKDTKEKLPGKRATTHTNT